MPEEALMYERDEIELAAAESESQVADTGAEPLDVNVDELYASVPPVDQPQGQPLERPEQSEGHVRSAEEQK